MAQLPNPFMNSTAISPRAVGSAVAFSDPSGSAATAVHNSALASAMTADTVAAPDLTDPPVAAAELFDEPSSNEGRPKETPASAPTKNPDVGVLADRIDWQEFFEAVMDERVVLFEPFEEPLPLFIRSGDHLRRWSA